LLPEGKADTGRHIANILAHKVLAVPWGRQASSAKPVTVKKAEADNEQYGKALLIREPSVHTCNLPD
jgi:hypothetical protein